MSGITGAWNLDGRPMNAELLAGMSRQMRHRGVDGERHRIDGAVGFACQHLWATAEDRDVWQPFVAPSGAMLVMDGRLDNRDELLDALDLDRAVGDTACAAAAFEKWDEEFATHLAGDFAIAIFDPRRRRLIIARDPIGVRPLYYFRNDRLFAFATEIKSLLVHPAIPMQPNEDGLADFMFIGARPLERPELTCFTHISALVPAHLAITTPDRTTVRRYWDFDPGYRLTLRSANEYVEAFRERFVEAVRRRCRSDRPIAVAVSGGLDSSSIFCQAETLRRTGASAYPATHGISYVSDESDRDERSFVHDIERQYGVTISQYPTAPLVGIVRGAEEQLRAIEAPFLDNLWGITRELHTRAAATGARVLLTGHWGDQVLFSAAYLVDLFNHLKWRTVWTHTREHAHYFDGAETSTIRRRFLFALARHHVPRALTPLLKWARLRLTREPLAKPWLSDAFLARTRQVRYAPVHIPGAFHSAHARSVFLEARSKYHVHSMEWNNKVAALHGMEAAFPMLDRDLIVFLMAIPGEMHALDGVPRALLREAMHDILPEPIRTRTWKADFSSLVNQAAAQDLRAMQQVLSPDCLGVRQGYFSASRLGPEVARLAASASSAECLESWALADTYGMEMWLQVFSKLKNQETMACE